jgi:hypothetical protein
MIRTTLRLTAATVALGALAVLAGVATSARADSMGPITFESPTYSPGSIQGQDGWGGDGTPINPFIDQAIVTTSSPASFASQSFRMSNAFTSGSFGDQVFSPSLANEAGETSAASDGLSGGTRQARFVAQWQFASATGTPQPGLSVVVSPDRGDGARMSWVQMTDTGGAGLEVNFYDYQHSVGNFVGTTLATGLDRSTAHTIKVQMDFVDGVANDVVKVYVDGALKITGTSWEDYFRDVEGNPTRPVDSLLFRVGGDPAPATNGYGFLFDNVSMSSGPATPDCTPTGFMRDGHDLTAAQIGGNVTGALDASGCNIGVYYDSAHTGNVATGSDIHGANYYGVVVNGTTANITGSSIHNIGEVPFNGTQHGNAVLYINGAHGTISGSTVTSYQKNGITVSGKNADATGPSSSKTSVSVLNNTVTGNGHINYIAQNGIQISYGATAIVRGDTVSANWYTPSVVTACGVLLFQASGVTTGMNSLFDNETNLCNAGRGGGKYKP